MAQGKTLKAINFDLDTKKLSAYYKNPSSAYKRLERHLNKLGFSHRQGSGYLSQKKLSDYDISRIVKTLSINNPWLANVVNRFDVTVVENQFDMKTVIKLARENQKTSTPKETFSFGAHKGKKSGRSPEKER